MEAFYLGSVHGHRPVDTDPLRIRCLPELCWLILELYGSISSVIITLLWFYLSALSVLVGAEVEAPLSQRGGRGSGDGLKKELRRREASTDG